MDVHSLPIKTAKLPQTYENALVALKQCDKVDEAKEWSNRAEAVASYARQAQDKELEILALKIRARAIRRCGELLGQIEKAQGARTDLGPAPDLGLTRSQTAREAGLSKRQQSTAMRVAKIPEDEFELEMEKERPETITVLAGMKSEMPKEFADATPIMGRISDLNENIKKANIRSVSAGVMRHEIDNLLVKIDNVIDFLGRLKKVLERRND